MKLFQGKGKEREKKKRGMKLKAQTKNINKLKDDLSDNRGIKMIACRGNITKKINDETAIRVSS